MDLQILPCKSGAGKWPHIWGHEVSLRTRLFASFPSALEMLTDYTHWNECKMCFKRAL